MQNKFVAALVLIFFAVTLATRVAAQSPSSWQPSAGHTQIPIWPKGAPDAKPTPGAEADTTTAKDNLIAGKPLIRLGNVSAPTITLYQHTTIPTGAAIVVSLAVVTTSSRWI